MLLEERNSYKPFQYPWAYEAYKTQRKLSWEPEEVSMADDITDWNGKNKDGTTILSEAEKKFLTDIFLFFTQADIDVSGGYAKVFLPMFRPPEVVMMLATFAASEAVHVDAYSLLIESLNLPKDTYTRFMAFPEMASKHGYLESLRNCGKQDPFLTAVSLAAFSAFGEGLQLFSSFAMLLNFSRTDGGRKARMKGMGQIVTWSIRDESLHFTSLIRLFKEFRKEYIPDNRIDALFESVYEVAKTMVNLEFDFIDLAYGEETEMNGLRKDDLKEYIKFIADRRMGQMDYLPIYGVSKNPLLWLEAMVNAVEHANFFEARATNYARASSTGTWTDVWAKLDNKGK